MHDAGRSWDVLLRKKARSRIVSCVKRVHVWQVVRVYICPDSVRRPQKLNTSESL